jgi:hypothetical protein
MSEEQTMITRTAQFGRRGEIVRAVKNPMPDVDWVSWDEMGVPAMPVDVGVDN